MFNTNKKSSTPSTLSHELQWKTIPSTIHTPSPRTYFTMNTYRNKLYIFGGFGDTKQRYNDLYIYDAVHYTWKLQSRDNNNLMNYPKPLYLHTTVVYHHYMYVFGGSYERDSNELYRYDIDNNAWFKFNSNSSTPSSRYGHSSCISDNKMYVVGGCKHNNTFYQDAYTYDFISNTWSRIADIPMDLAYHQLVTHNNTVYLFGGYNGVRFSPYTYIYDTRCNKWNIVTVHGREPPPISGTTVAYNNIDSELYLFGGYTAHNYINDLYRLSFDSMTWELVNVSNRPQPRAYLQSAYINDTVYVYGGYDGTACSNDMRSLKIIKSINLYKIIHEMNVEQQVKYIIQHYASNNNGTPVIGTKQLHAILNNIHSNIQHDQQLMHTASNGKSNNKQPQLYPLDLSRVDDLIGLGFTRTHVLSSLNQYRSHGIDTSDYELIVDLLLTQSTSNNSSSNDNNNKNILPRELSAAQQQYEDRICKICYDHEIDSALLSCGHLCVCTACAARFVQDKQPCPVCRQPLASYVKVYYT